MITSNPDYFKKTDTLTELTELIRKNKTCTAPKLAKMIMDFYEETVFPDYHPSLK
jgi:hypothetical protein